MDWEFGSATDGNIAVMGELDLHGARRGRAGVYAGIGSAKGITRRRRRPSASLAMPFEQHRSRFIEQWQRAANPEWLAAKAATAAS
jgi:glucoamylase